MTGRETEGEKFMARTSWYKNGEEAEEGKNFITVPLQDEKVSEEVMSIHGKISAFVDTFVQVVMFSFYYSGTYKSQRCSN